MSLQVVHNVNQLQEIALQACVRSQIVQGIRECCMWCVAKTLGQHTYIFGCDNHKGCRSNVNNFTLP